MLENRPREDAEQARREELRAIAADVATDLLVGRFVHPYEVAGRVSEARKKALVALSHECPSGYPEPP